MSDTPQRTDANPYGKTPGEIERSNRWFRVALALGKQEDFIEMLRTERDMASEQTQHDEHDRQWFNSGWNACRREVLAMAEHQGDGAAVDWARTHPATEPPNK